MSLKTKRGFTLIELLVVIAIIGILSSVVLASLNTARDKGHDASIKASINNIRAAAEVFYDNNGATYSGVCADGQINDLEAAADSENDAGSVDCFDQSLAGITVGYAANAQLRADNTRYFCVDSEGNATTTFGTTIANNDANCDA